MIDDQMSGVVASHGPCIWRSASMRLWYPPFKQVWSLPHELRTSWSQLPSALCQFRDVDLPSSGSIIGLI